VVIIRLKQQEMYAHTTVTCGKSRRQSKSDNNGRRGVKWPDKPRAFVISYTGRYGSFR